MDEFGMQLKVKGAPQWDVAEIFTTEAQKAGGDEELVYDLIEKYCAGRACEDAEFEISSDARYMHKDLESARQALDSILQGSSTYGIATTLPDGETIVAMRPNTPADQFVETAYRKGILAAAGFWV